MNSLKNISFSLFVIILYIITNCNCIEHTINSEDLNEISQCFYHEKSTFGEKEEITYEIINNILDRTLFVQFKNVDSIVIYHSFQNQENAIYSRTKEENNYGNYYFEMNNNIDKYYIKVELSETDFINFKICFNLFEGKGNTFKPIEDKSQKISSIDVINSGNFPFYINENVKPFTALRFKKELEKTFSFPSFYIKTYFVDSDEVLSIHINELYSKGNYQYIIWNLDVSHNQKIKDIFIEARLNIENEEENNNIFEFELIDFEEIHYGYNLNINNLENYGIPTKIYYINLKKYIFQQDLDILYMTNDIKNEIFISNIDNINNHNIINLDKKFMVINKYLLEDEAINKINPYLLLIIIDESFIINNDEEIFFNFIFSGSTHDIYNYKENIRKDELFKDNKMLIKANTCRSSYYINYFTDINVQKIIEYESIIGNTKLYQSNKNDLSNSIDDYFLTIKSFPITDIKNCILDGNYSILKINCLNGNEQILSYIYIYDKNPVNNIINFKNQKTLLYIENNNNYSFKFNEKLNEEKFHFRIRVFQKDEGQFNLKIKYNNIEYTTLNDQNFLELKHDINITSTLDIQLEYYNDMVNESPNSLILEIIKEIYIDKNEIKTQKSNIMNSVLPFKNYLYFEFEDKRASQANIILKNEENENINICIHKGFGTYPYIIKPICQSNEFINLKPKEEINFNIENPYLTPLIKNINNNDNPLYISVNSDKKIKFSYIYEKYSDFNISNEYKDIDFKGKEIIQLENSKKYPVIYYQINICQDINSNYQEYTFEKPLFNYYFEKRGNVEVNDITNNIYKEYELHTENPTIVFNTDGVLKGKFKYVYGNKNKIKYNENYSNKINIEQNKKILKISVDSPFYGDIIMNIIIMTSDYDKYNGYCDLIDLYEYLKNNEDIMYYGQRFIQKLMNIDEENNIINVEIESNQILDLNRKNAKVFVIISLKEINFDVFYYPVSFYINLRDYSTEIEEKNKISKNIFIFIICLIIVFLVFIVYRNCQNKNSDEINYQKKIQLNDGNINESNKLFI